MQSREPRHRGTTHHKNQKPYHIPKYGVTVEQRTNAVEPLAMNRGHSLIATGKDNAKKDKV